MAVHRDLQFCGGLGQRASLADALRQRVDAGVRDEVDRLTDAGFKDNVDAALAPRVTEIFRAVPIVLEFDESVGGAGPTRTRVNGSFGGHAEVYGPDVTKTIPFDGDAALFGLQPDQFDLNPPRDHFRGHQLTLGMTVPESDSEAAVRYVEETLLAKVELYVSRQAQALELFNGALARAALQQIKRRRATIGAASDIVSRVSGR